MRAGRSLLFERNMSHGKSAVILARRDSAATAEPAEPGHQVGCAATHAPAMSGLLKCAAHSLVVCQAQVIIAAKIQQAAAVYDQLASLRRLDQPSPPVEPLDLAVAQLLPDIVEIVLKTIQGLTG